MTKVINTESKLNNEIIHLLNNIIGKHLISYSFNGCLARNEGKYINVTNWKPLYVTIQNNGSPFLEYSFSSQEMVGELQDPIIILDIKKTNSKEMVDCHFSFDLDLLITEIEIFAEIGEFVFLNEDVKNIYRRLKLEIDNIPKKIVRNVFSENIIVLKMANARKIAIIGDDAFDGSVSICLDSILIDDLLFKHKQKKYILSRIIK